MSKYHKGDKFIVEIKEVMNSDNGTLYRSDFKTLTFDDNGLDKLQKYEQPTISEDTLEMERMKALNEGRNEVWELVRKLTVYNYREGGYDNDEIHKIYGTGNLFQIFKNYTPQEALAKLEAYEKEQAEIKVGDVVKPEKGVEFVVTYISLDSHLFGITFTGDTYSALPMRYCAKTGKHIDIQNVLSKIAE